MTDREKMELYIGLIAEEIQDKYDNGNISKAIYEHSMAIVDGYLDILHKSLNMNSDMDYESITTKH